MKLRKAPRELVDLFNDAVAGIECQRRVMFGYPACFINGYLFAGLFEDQLFLRLPESTVRQLRAGKTPVSSLEPMPGRPMRDYTVIPAEIYRKGAALRGLLQASVTHTAGLPPKRANKSGRKGSSGASRP